MIMTMYEVIENNARECGDEIAYSYFNKKVTYKEFYKRIERVAKALKAYKIGEGDKVGICLPNSPAVMDILYAVNKIGAVAVMLNPKSPVNELKIQLEMTECKLVFYSSIVSGTFRNINIRSVAVSIFYNLPLLFKFVCIKKVFPYYCAGNSYRKFLRKGSGYKGVITTSKDDERDAVIIFSGGTGGEIKAVVHNSRSFNNSAVNCIETEKPLPDKVTMLSVLPAFHIFGLTVAIHLPLVAKGTAILVPFFHMNTLADIIAKDCPAFMAAVPTIFERLLKCKKFEKYAKCGMKVDKFRHGFVGGDTLADETRDEFNSIIKKWGGTGYISMGYGMSECCPISVNDRDSGVPSSIGHPFNTVDVIIWDNDNNCQCSEGELGEIWISSSYSMKYGIDDKGNKYYLHNYQGKDYIRTKDMGYVKDGFLYYNCRQRRIIKVSGHSIFAKNVENVINSHKKVEASYVVGVPHKSRGQSVFVYVVANDESYSKEKLARELAKLCKDNLVIYAQPAKLVFVKKEQIPITAMLKVSYGQLEKKAISYITE